MFRNLFQPVLSKDFLKKNFNNYFFIFSDRFDMLISKITFKK
jgi:hypothetical protein